MTVSAYVWGDLVHFEWASTAPFNYDYFNVRWSFGASGTIPTDQQSTYRGSSRTSGGVWIPVPRRTDTIRSDDTTYGVTLIVEGCDDGGFLDPSNCNQGWTIPLHIRA